MTSILIEDWGISSQLIIDEAEKQGLRYKILSRKDNLFFIEDKFKKIFFKSIDFGKNSSFGIKVANNKELNYILAEENNIKVPKSYYINRINFGKIDLKEFNIIFPVVTKPIDGGHGDGVSLNLNNYSELEKGLLFSFSDPETSRVVIQEQISGTDHRILVINGKVEAITKRVPPFVIGNGKGTIRELIEMENLNPLRGKGGDHDAPMSKIRIDSELESTIKQQQCNYNTVLEKGKQLYVRENANLSSGGIAIDVTDYAHTEVLEEAIKMSKVLKLWLCGIDFMCGDISKGLEEGKGAIIESGSTPGIRMHHFPSEGKSRNIAKIILDSALNNN